MEIDAAFSVVGFDGEEVFWPGAGFGKKPEAKTVIPIPSGRHDLVINYFFEDKGTRERLTRVKISGDFVPNRAYCLLRDKNSGDMPIIIIEKLNR